MTDEMIGKMMDAGLSKQQAQSNTAKVLVDMFMPDDGKQLIAEANRQVNDAGKMLVALSIEFNELKNKIDQMSDALCAALEAEKEYGSFTDERARNAVTLYAAIMGMRPSKKGAVDEDQILENAGYVTYAYLGGQAKREVSYSEIGGKA